MEKILIVEDNEKNMKLVRDIVRHGGHETIEAATGVDGVRLARERRPDLILMDIQLPDMDGATALGRLRAEAVTKAIPVVAVTAFAMLSDRDRLLGAGFDGYLAKPIDVKAFPEQVRRYCETSRSEAR